MSHKFDSKNIIDSLKSVRSLPYAQDIVESLEYKIKLTKSRDGKLKNFIIYNLNNDEVKSNIAISLVCILNFIKLNNITQKKDIIVDIPIDYPIFNDFLDKYNKFSQDNNQYYKDIQYDDKDISIITDFSIKEPHLDDGLLHTSLWAINRHGTLLFDSNTDILKSLRQLNNVSRSLGNLPKVETYKAIQNVDSNFLEQLENNQVITFFGGLTKHTMPLIHKSPQSNNHTPIYNKSENRLSAFIKELKSNNTKDEILQDLANLPLDFVDEIESMPKLLCLSMGGRANI